jgi:TolA-binding protein
MNLIKKLGFLFPFFGFAFSLLPVQAQQGWEVNALTSAEYYFASKAFGPAVQYYQIQPYYPSLSVGHDAANFYTIASALRLNTAGAEKMLSAYMVDHPTSYLTETAFFDAANFYFNQGRYSYALKWYSKIGEREVAKVQRPEYNFKKGYSYFVSKQYKNAKPLFEKVKGLPVYQSDANYYLGYIAYQLEDFEEANRNFDKLNKSSDDNTVGYFQADMNFKLGRFEQAILLAKPSLKGADEKETSELSKIIGESYFNLKDYRSALPFLIAYKGKRGKWNNTDYYQLGYTHYSIKEYDNAIAQFNKIINGKNAVAQNAYYHLADSYLQTDQKTAALNAFKRAAEMQFDPIIAEDALLNYARLSYEIGNSYESPSAVLQRFVETYPKNKAVNEIEELLLDSYVNSQNFDAALGMLDKFYSSDFDEAKQIVSYLKANSLYKSGKFASAIEYYTAAIKAYKNPLVIANATYWQAQANYELKEYALALELFHEAKRFPKFSSLPFANEIDYHRGYCYFQLKNYPAAIGAFEDFLKQAQTVKYERDARLRLGDSHFVLKAYWPAMDQYEKVTTLAPQRSGYAMYQQAISYGFVNRLAQKIVLLKELIAQFPTSSLVDDCQYELALSYTKKGDNEAAITAYDIIINQTKGSPYRSKALLNKGLIQYNKGETAMAESTLKNLVQTYPDEALAQQALQTVKEIAIEENTVAEFSAWLKEIEITSLPNLQLEKAAFDAIDRLLNDGKKKALKRALESYLEEYGSGGNSLRANFLFAEIAFEEEEWGEASIYYDKVIQAPLNEYSEQALVRMTQSLVQLEQKEKALPFWGKLVEIAQFEENKRYAQFNLMQYAFEAKNMELATRYAEEILTLSNLEERVKWDAYYILAKASQERKDLPKASAAFKQLEKAPQGERAVEALYFDALQKYNKLQFADSNKVIENIAENYGGYPRWGAKSLLLMSKNFYQLDDAFQATYILESIIENFNQFSEIVKEAKKDIENIKMVEAKNNASISVETSSNE